MVDWELFGAGMGLIGLTVFILILNGILATFNVKVKVPWFIPTAIFIVALLLLMQSVGIITGLNELAYSIAKESNIPEFILGLAIVVISVTQRIYNILGVTPSGWLRLGMLIFGVVLIFDALRILPVIYYLSQLIGYAISYMTQLLASYPWLSMIIVLSIFVVITLMFVKLRRGVSA